MASGFEPVALVLGDRRVVEVAALGQQRLDVRRFAVARVVVLRHPDLVEEPLALDAARSMQVVADAAILGSRRGEHREEGVAKVVVAPGSSLEDRDDRQLARIGIRLHATRAATGRAWRWSRRLP